MYIELIRLMLATVGLSGLMTGFRMLLMRKEAGAVDMILYMIISAIGFLLTVALLAQSGAFMNAMIELYRESRN